MGLFDKLRSGLSRTAGSLLQNWSGLFQPGAASIPAESLRILEDRLVAADVGVSAARSLLSSLQERSRKEGRADPPSVALFLREAVEERMGKDRPVFSLPRPGLLLLVGVNGAGKTTTAGKLAAHW